MGFHAELSHTDAAQNRAGKERRSRQVGKHAWIVSRQVSPA
jgi:hypothetical protein